MITPFSVGQRATLQRTFTMEDVRTFAALSGDANPLHIDPEYARQTPFGRPIVHGMLTASLLSNLLGEELPGPGTIYLGQTLNFLAPVYVDEEVTVAVEVTHIREDKPIVTLRTTVNTADGVALDGEAVVKVTFPTTPAGTVP